MDPMPQSHRVCNNVFVQDISTYVSMYDIFMVPRPHRLLKTIPMQTLVFPFPMARKIPSSPCSEPLYVLDLRRREELLQIIIFKR